DIELNKEKIGKANILEQDQEKYTRSWAKIIFELDKVFDFKPNLNNPDQALEDNIEVSTYNNYETTLNRVLNQSTKMKEASVQGLNSTVEIILNFLNNTKIQ